MLHLAADKKISFLADTGRRMRIYIKNFGQNSILVHANYKTTPN
jgi:hypothetical protein